MKRTYKYRIYPTKKQEETLLNQLFLCRRLYNKMLKQRIEVYQKKQVTLFYKHQQRQLPLIKSNKPEYKGIHSQVLQNVLKKLDLAFQGFFRRIKNKEKAGFPRYKGKNRLRSLCYTQSGFGFTNQGKLKLSKIGHIKLKKHRECVGKLKTCTIEHTPSGKWYCCITVEVPDNASVQEIKTNKAVGIDLGINTFAYLSDGKSIETTKHLKQKRQQLLKTQRELSRKKKGSKNRIKARIKLARVHEKVAHSRNNFQHQQSRKLLGQYDVIVHEKLQIRNMSRSSKGTLEKPGKQVKQKSGLNRSILDMGWNQFIQMLSYKAEEAGKVVVGVDPKYTSQCCSSCGGLVKKDLSQRVHECMDCGLQMNRDWNASLNILEKYQTISRRNYGSKACGGDVIRQPMKQEAPTIAALAV